MKKIISLILISTIAIQSFIAVADTQTLSTIMLEQEYALSASNLTAQARKDQQSKFDAKVKAYLTEKSDTQILSEVTELVDQMPDSPEKKNFQNIISENKSAPAEALKEIVDSKSFNKMNSGDSANWSVFENTSFLLALGGVLVIAAILVWNRKASQSKVDALDPDSYFKPGDGYFSFRGTGSDRRSCTERRDQDGTMRTECESCYDTSGPGREAVREAEQEALLNCMTNPLMTAQLCRSGSMSSSSSGSGDYCDATATISFKLQ